MGLGLPGYKTKPAQSIFAEVSANSAIFTKQGNVSNAYLSIGNVVSDTTGFPVRVENAQITYAAVETESGQADTYTVDVYEWDGSTETLLLTITVTAADNGDFTPVTPISIGLNNSLRAKINTGSCRNPVVQVFFSGELVN